MKTKLFTQNSFLVMLMTLVLAFSVPSIADALTFSTSRSGDLATELPAPNDFDIRFSVSLKSPQQVNSGTRRASQSEINQAATSGGDSSSTDHYDDSEYTDGDTHYYITQDGTGTNSDGDTLTQKRNWSTQDEAYHYNNEQVTITATNANITHIGRYDITDAATHTLMETGEDGSKLTSSITVTLSAASANTVPITISDETPEADRPTGIDQAPDITFTVYVVPGTSTQELSLTGTGTDGVETLSDFGTTRIDGLFGAGTNVPVTYQVEGSGRVFVQAGADRKTRETNKLETSSSAPVHLKMNRSSNKVTVWVRGQDAKRDSQSVTFINQYVDPQITAGDNQNGATEGRLPDPLEVTVKDANNKVIPGGVVVGFALGTGATNGMFIPVVGTTVYVSAADALVTTAPTTPDALTVTATSTVPAPAGAIYVKTDSRGIAKTYFELGDTAGPQRVTISVNGNTANFTDTFFRATATDVDPSDAAKIEIESGNGQRADVDEPLDDPLVVIVKDIGGRIVAGAPVTFTTSSGELSAPETMDPGTYTVPDPNIHTDRFIVVNTDVNGKASVRYNVGDLPGAKEVFASITRNGRAITKTFNINGRTSTTTQPTQPTQPTAPTATLVPLTVSGTAGGTATLTVTAAANTTVTAGGLNDTLPAGSASSFTQSGTTYTSTLTLPSTAGTYTLSVFVGTTRYSVSVNVTAGTTTTPQTGTLRISNLPLSAAIGSQQVATVTATDSDGNPVSGVVVSLSVTSGGGVFTPASVTTREDGTATSTLTRGTTAGTDYFVTASATGYTSSPPSRIVITSATPTTGSTPTQTTTTPTQTPTTPTSTAQTPDLLSIDGEATRTGTLNEALDAPLVVEVLDNKGSRVRNARVTFRVRTGQGRLSQRGNGRAVATTTNTQGLASADYTPMSARSTVEASVKGVSETVTFTITTDGSTPTTTTTPDTGDTPSRTIAPVVKVKAANRPPMLWVDGGAIYALVGADAQRFAPSVENALNIAIGGDKVYWTEKTGDSAGTINAANLDGSGVKELKSIQAVPMGIAVDTAGSKLYWTNSRGRIQRAALDGSGIQNVLQNLSLPMDIALADGNAYWTEATGAVKYVNLTGQKNVRNISTGTDPAGSLAIAGGKVYWTEMTGASAGTVNSANLNGSGAKQLASIRAVPMGIAVDGSRSKLYWTNSRGRVQSANLNGSKIQNVVDGLGMPGDMVISNSITAPAAATSATTTPTASKSKYDINGDGKVDSTDTGLIVLAISTGDTAKKYDVNGDGTVNFSDYVLVSENIDAGAAGAPSVFGMKMTAEQVARLQEQIDLLIASGDRSPAAMRALIYFQQLIATARPEKTQLLANYPNPFNPETWIPYELATDTDVRLTIYNAQGIVVRVLHLGQQSAGYYTDRQRAAYWDGRNALGEQVASGIYFYQLETDDMSSLRKMVILK